MKSSFALAVVAAAFCLPLGLAQAADEVQPAAKKTDNNFSLIGGKITLQAPENWVKQTPKVRIIEHEFSVPAAKGDKEAGRVTVTGAGGSVEANLKRWTDQFTAPEDGKLEPKTEKKTMGFYEVHYFDLTGTYKDMPGGPFAGGPSTMRPDYRMLAVVILTGDGNYFVKFYGPKNTVAENEAGFKKMIEGLNDKQNK